MVCAKVESLSLNVAEVVGASAKVIAITEAALLPTKPQGWAWGPCRRFICTIGRTCASA